MHKGMSLILSSWDAKLTAMQVPCSKYGEAVDIYHDIVILDESWHGSSALRISQSDACCAFTQNIWTVRGRSLLSGQL